MTPNELLLWRRTRGLNQGQVADLLGKSRQTVINWERGHHALPDNLHVMLLHASQPSADLAQKITSGTITPAAFPKLYAHSREHGGQIPGATHPSALARGGWLGWPGCTWRNASMATAARPHRDILLTDEYQGAIEAMLTGVKHPGVEAKRAFFARGAHTLNEMQTLRASGTWVAPWADAEPALGYFYWAEMPRVTV